MPKRQTQNEYVLELKSKNKNIELLGNYINRTTSITHKCKTHNEILNDKPKNVLKFGLICCANRKQKRWTTNDWIYFSKRLYEKKFNYSKAQYIDAYTFIELECPIHGWIKINPGKHLKGILKKSGEKNLGCTQCNFERSQLRNKKALFFPDTQEKICLLCSEKKSVLEFSKNRSSVDGYFGYCKPCKKFKAREKREKVKLETINKFKKDNPGVYIDVSKNFSLRKAFFFPKTNEKICFGCKEKKKTINFYKSNKTEDGFDTNCKSCSLKIQQTFI